MMTDRQRLFVEAYLLEPNGKKAAIAAGYSAATAEVTASKLLRHPKVSAELARRRAMTEAATGITVERVITELAKLGFSDIRQVIAWRANVARMVEDPETGDPALQITNEVELIDSAKLTEDIAAAIAEVAQTKDGTLRVKMHDKLGALVKIGQHLGMFRPLPSPAEKPGKKERQRADAENAAAGSEWDGLIN